MKLSSHLFKSNEASEPSAHSTQDEATVLILHGLFGSKRNWQSIAKHLAKQYTVYTLDLRNHGESEHADTMSYESMAADVFQFISDNNLQQLAIVGHSMGGKVAMTMALQKPELIRQMVIIDIAPVAYEHSFAELISALNTLPLDQISNRQQANEFLKTSIQPQSLRQFMLQNLYKQEDQQTFAWRINLQAIQASLNDLMAFPSSQHYSPYQNKVLFLKGEKSDYITHQYERQIYKLFPNALFITVAGAGHWLHAENPDFVVSEISKFIK